MYQWVEKERKEGDRKVIKYEKTWSAIAINSASFRESEHENPPFMIEEKVFMSKTAKFGSFVLNEKAINKIPNERDLLIDSD